MVILLFIVLKCADDSRILATVEGAKLRVFSSRRDLRIRGGHGLGADNGFGSRGRGERLFGGFGDASSAGYAVLLDWGAGGLATGGEAASLGIIHRGRPTRNNLRTLLAGVLVSDRTGLGGGAGGEKKKRKDES